MSEKFISPQEAQNAAKMKMMRESIAQRTPEEAADMFNAGVDAMTGAELKENRAFYERMAGVTVLRATVQRPHSDEVYAAARQLYGPLGYDAVPRKIRRI